MTQPTTNSIHRAWLRRRRGRVVVVGVVICAVGVGGLARAWGAGHAARRCAPRALLAAGKRAESADKSGMR